MITTRAPDGANKMKAPIISDKVSTQHSAQPPLMFWCPNALQCSDWKTHFPEKKKKYQAPISPDEVSTQHLGDAPSFCGRSRSVWSAGIFAIHRISHPHVYQHIHICVCTVYIQCILYTYSHPYVCTMWVPLPSHVDSRDQMLHFQ